MHPLHAYRWHYGPSRFLWFCIGAAASAYWMSRDRHRLWLDRCNRAPIQSPSVPPSSEAGPSYNPQYDTRAGSAPWDEGERMLAFSRQAGDKVTELSEATLDSLLSTVEALKAKLAEHRAEREKQMGEERKQSPPT